MLPTWDTEEIFLDGDAYFEHLLRDIDTAHSTITMEMYIFNDDMLGRKVAAHLIKAHQRGVKVQIIVDGVGSYTFFNKLHRVFSKKGMKVKMYNPLPFYHPIYGKLNFTRRMQVFASRINQMNKRNHRKIITIDNSILYVGSFNITAEHTRYHFEKAWKDMGARVTGENVKYAVLNFKKMWKLRDYYRFKKQVKHLKWPHWRHFPLILNANLFMKRHYYKNFLNKINKAEDRIWLMTPYFIPKRRLIRALGNAAKRGVDVRLLISFKTDVVFFNTLQYFYYGYLVAKGVKIYQYTETVLHAKTYMIDEWITIGSTNLNHRSFMHDLEVDLVLQETENKKIIEQNFIESTSDKNSVTMEHLNQRPILDRLLCRLFFLFKYWF